MILTSHCLFAKIKSIFRVMIATSTMKISNGCDYIHLNLNFVCARAEYRVNSKITLL